MPRTGSILLFMMGLMAVLIVMVFGLLRTLELDRGSSLVQRRTDFARMAAEMGMQHAIATCVAEYSAASEIRDGAVVAPVSRVDAPTKNAFMALAPRNQRASQAPTPQWDVPHDQAFDYLFNSYYSNRYTRNQGNESWPPGWFRQFRTSRTYARYIEANRFAFSPNVVYDSSTYDQGAGKYDPAHHDATVGRIATPYPPVQPFDDAATLAAQHNSDHPLLLDANCRAISIGGFPDLNAALSAARYRLRYACYVEDQSASLWLNTDTPWLSAAGRSNVREGYRDSIETVAGALGKGAIMESVFLGQGPIGNVALRKNGINADVPCDWPERGGAPMSFRSSQTTGFKNNHRIIHSIHGTKDDVALPDGTNLGHALLSWNDLGFALYDPNPYFGDWSSKWREITMDYLCAPQIRGDDIAQRATTPFGNPATRGAATGHPWALNPLLITGPLLRAMVVAYVPPAARPGVSTSITEKITACIPYVDNSQVPPATYDPPAVTWTYPASYSHAVQVPGYDLFTDSFHPTDRSGTQLPRKPFLEYPTMPACRDFWRANPPAARGDIDNSQMLDPSSALGDKRANLQRYPGEAFFTVPASDASHTAEVYAQSAMRWSLLSSDPRQIEADPGWTADALYPWNGMDHLARHVVFYAEDGTSTATAGSNTNIFLPSGALGSLFAPTVMPFGMDSKFKVSLADNKPAQGRTFTYYQPPSPTPVVPGETYPKIPTAAADKATLAATPPASRDTLTAPAFPGYNAVDPSTPGNPKLDPSKWKIEHIIGSTTGTEAQSNSYWQRAGYALYHAIIVAQVANLSWSDWSDARSQALWAPISGTDAASSHGITYAVRPNRRQADEVRKGKAGAKHASDPNRAVDTWDPKAADFASTELLDRQFLANLGESFMRPGVSTTEQARAERPPRYGRKKPVNDQWANMPNGSQLASAHGCLSVGEYRVTNNIRTLLTPIDASSGASLTPSSLDPQIGVNAPPRKLWLLDEWDAWNDAVYAPRTVVGSVPTALARTRAKLMERVLNDWRMSFFGSAASYAAHFHPKDFDGDGKVFCSGYLDQGIPLDLDTSLRCWRFVDGSIDAVRYGAGCGPGSDAGLSLFSLTGCLDIQRSNQYKIQVRGELFDRILGKPAAQYLLESALLLDADRNISRAAGGSSTGMEDSAVMMLRPIHNYERSHLTRVSQ